MTLSLPSYTGSALKRELHFSWPSKWQIQDEDYLSQILESISETLNFPALQTCCQIQDKANNSNRHDKQQSQVQSD